MRMVRIVLAAALLAAPLALGGCRQTCSVWQDTRDGVQSAFRSPSCCPDPCGRVYADPIYCGGCGGDNRIGSGGAGALKIP